jgi:Mo-dependent nitrogenase C-terminus
MNTSLLSCPSDPLSFIRNWLSAIEIRNSRVAHLLSRMIPASCPFERDIKLFGHILAHIPPLCKFNPFYDQIVELRFKALTYLANTTNMTAAA